jgi:hypothetical protein
VYIWEAAVLSVYMNSSNMVAWCGGALRDSCQDRLCAHHMNMLAWSLRLPYHMKETQDTWHILKRAGTDDCALPHVKGPAQKLPRCASKTVRPADYTTGVRLPHHHCCRCYCCCCCYCCCWCCRWCCCSRRHRYFQQQQLSQEEEEEDHQPEGL